MSEMKDISPEKKAKIGKALLTFARQCIPLITTLIGSLLGIIIGGNDVSQKVGTVIGAMIGGKLV